MVALATVSGTTQTGVMGAGESGLDRRPAGVSDATVAAVGKLSEALETIEEVRRWPVEIEAVTHDRLVAVAARYLVPARSVTGYLTKARDPDVAIA